MRTAVVVGSANCVFSDLKKLDELIQRQDYTVFTVNFAAMLPIKADYVCAIHGDYIDTYKAIAMIKCEEFGWNKQGIYTVSTFGHADYIYDDMGCSGTSGRFAVDVALRLGFDKVILCGVPIDGTERFYGDIKHDYSTCIDLREWTKQDSSKVRSFSGNTKQLLGEPTPSWLNGGEE